MPKSINNMIILGKLGNILNLHGPKYLGLKIIRLKERLALLDNPLIIMLFIDLGVRNCMSLRLGAYLWRAV